MNKIEFLYNRLQTLPVSIRSFSVSDDKIEFFDFENKTQIRLNKDTFLVEYVNKKLDLYVIEMIINEFLLQYQSVERINKLRKHIYV